MPQAQFTDDLLLESMLSALNTKKQSLQRFLRLKTPEAL